MKEKRKICRIILGAIIGAVYRVINIFCPLNSVVVSVGVAFLQVAAGYGRNIIRLTLFFIAEAVLTAGILYAIKSSHYGLLFVLCMAFMPLALSKMRRGVTLSKLNRNLKIKKDGKEISVQGFVDSGNGSGLIIIGKQHAKALLGNKADAMNSLKEGDYGLAMCNTVKGDVLIPTFTADSVISDGEELNVKIGIVKEKMVYALLPANLLETRDFDVDGKVDIDNKTTVS